MDASKEICEQFFDKCMPIIEKNNFFSFSDFIACLAVLALAWTVSQTINGRILGHSFDHKGIYLFSIAFLGSITLLTDYFVAAGVYVPFHEKSLGISTWRALLAGSSLFLFVFLIYIGYHKKVRPSRLLMKGYAVEMMASISKSSPDHEFLFASEKLSNEINGVVSHYLSSDQLRPEYIWSKRIIDRLSEPDINLRLLEYNTACWMEVFKSCFKTNTEKSRYFLRKDMADLATQCVETLINSKDMEIPTRWVDWSLDLNQIVRGLNAKQTIMIRDVYFMRCFSGYFIQLLEDIPFVRNEDSVKSICGASELVILFICSNPTRNNPGWFHELLQAVHVRYFFCFKLRKMESISCRLAHLYLAKKAISETQADYDILNQSIQVISEELLNTLNQMQEIMLGGTPCSEDVATSILNTMNSEGLPETYHGRISSDLIENSWLSQRATMSVGLGNFMFKYLLIFRWVDRELLSKSARSILSNFDTMVFFGYSHQLKYRIEYQISDFNKALGLIELSNSNPRLLVSHPYFGAKDISLSMEKISITGINM